MKQELHLTKKDFRVDTFRAGGKGGQHQNTTDSGVRITHTETGISSECRETDSQHRNKKRAFRLLAKKLIGYYYTDEKSRFQSGKITVRTYNQSNDLVTDMQTKKKYSYKKTIGKNDIAQIIEDRRCRLI